ncbi:MAG: DNA-binding NarL/FixJ family response regulator [Olleya marilimosa]|jgi:DNA-binding NarL/FixJ family response regulator|uniref:response regulator n=1 Tax=Olleya marilimosa TaxID=272164 RepID=UPI000488B827|nr:response regulator transcription factor [Olleya marilimosa]MBD3890272.1 response regulator transcription factor [Olleya marilimosa]PIB32921.1 DNA-binding response regulator [Gaetbulibacter sp. 5U11]|tara:strand:+ start:163136 stop:163777 length:642 start_codon:yes stop_codon:yes gene_type:complete
MKASIVIADDHPLMLRGLSDFITSRGFKIIGSAEDGQTAYNLIVKLKPDLALLDIRMPKMTGLDVAEACFKNELKTKIILITFDNEEHLFDKARACNVYGYILKEFAVEEIETCIKHVLKGEAYFSEEIASYLNSKVTFSSSNLLEILTPTELKVVKLLADKLTSAEISKELASSTRTIEKHRSNIVKKLDLKKSHNELMLWANMNKDLIKNT